MATDRRSHHPLRRAASDRAAGVVVATFWLDAETAEAKRLVDLGSGRAIQPIEPPRLRVLVPLLRTLWEHEQDDSQAAILLDDAFPDLGRTVRLQFTDTAGRETTGDALAFKIRNLDVQALEDIVGTYLDDDQLPACIRSALPEPGG